VTSCPTCREPVPPEARFCPRCGGRLSPDSTPAARPDRSTVPDGRNGPAATLAATRDTPEGTRAPAPHEPDERRAAESTRARGRLVARAVVLLLLVGLVVAVARSVLPGDDDRTLALPPPGEVAAAFVEGEPVFVVHDDDGDVRVLDAVDPHVPGDPKVLAHCADSGTFEDLRHGSRFTRRGEWMGGPAPTGMAAYEIVERDDERVVIAERGDPPSRSDAQFDGDVIGPNCLDRLVGVDGEPEPGAVDDLVMHDGPVSEDDVRWYPVTGIAELLEELARLGDPDAS
jgi:nitrite reductase/ring-hydroxylating ferredoxin subunit